MRAHTMMCLNARIKFFAFGCTICAARDECAGCWSHGVRSEEKGGRIFFSLFFLVVTAYDQALLKWGLIKQKGGHRESAQ